MKKLSIAMVPLASILVAGPALAGDISGTYIASGSIAAEILQIVETNGQLQGEEQLRVPRGPINASPVAVLNTATLAQSMRSGGVHPIGTVE